MELLRDKKLHEENGDKTCLNPCCNGITERHKKWYHEKIDNGVLILVVMELLRDAQETNRRLRRQSVLILVVMELLRDDIYFLCFTYLICLNPCCNGITERQKNKV